MPPVIALIGRPNVGKSTLFNRLTKTRDALVADFPGLTRDRLFGQGKVGGKQYIVVDTGGVTGAEQGIEEVMVGQTKQAVAEADAIIFLVDGRAGLTAVDQEIAQYIRKHHKKTFVAVNKAEGLNEHIVLSDFYVLGLGEPHAIAAAHGSGVHELMDAVLAELPEEEQTEITAEQGIKIALVGRPNVGKSTLTNRLLGEDRVVVYDQPGTTRDSIYIPYTRFDKPYVLIDTAGVRRRGAVRETIEKFSVVKTLQAIESAHVAVLVMDAREGITEQDLHLLGFILQAGKGVVIAINKWDGLSEEQKENIHNDISRRLNFADFVKIKFISALHGTGVGELYPLIEHAYESAYQKFSTSKLTRILEQAIASHQPPLVNGRRIKLRYAHAGGHNPPIIVIHGKQTKSLPGSYKRYLEGFYRKALNLVGTPIKIEFRDSENPYI
jgi:GTP-binding protein